MFRARNRADMQTTNASDTGQSATAVTAEAVGTAFLLVSVVGSGIMGESLADGNAAIALLANSLATGAMLYVLIAVLGPLSGAHFNPAVTIAIWSMRDMNGARAITYMFAQIAGALVGVWLAHAMFDQPLLQVSQTARSSGGQWISEAMATFGLVGVILLSLQHRPQAVAAIVGLYIGAAYWFTASTSFANPAVTFARAWTDTFAGITPMHVPIFIACQFAGALLALTALRHLRRATGGRAVDGAPTHT
jgi:glycerol uptake facilitator-like aquaporin